MVGRPGRVKSKGSEASNSQDGDTPKNSRKRQGRPRKADHDDSPLGSRDGTPFTPANRRSAKKRPIRDATRLASHIMEFDPEEDRRSHRLARFIEEHPECREEYAKWMEERPSFPPWIEESDQIEHDGTVFREGDIVCLFDEDDDDEENLPYYAQIRSLIRDQYMRPFAWITWLVPRQSAPDAYTFSAEHFVHSLIDHKLYELEFLRWHTDQPDLPAYQNFDEHRVVIDRERARELRQRHIDLYKAANFAPEADVDIVRAGDLKLIRTRKHAKDWKRVLELQQEREADRREEEAEMAKARAEGRVFRKSSSITNMSRSIRSVSTDDPPQSDDEDDEEGEVEDTRKVFKRAASITSSASKGTTESAPSSVKPSETMEES